MAGARTHHEGCRGRAASCGAEGLTARDAVDLAGTTYGQECAWAATSQMGGHSYAAEDGSVCRAAERRMQRALRTIDGHGWWQRLVPLAEHMGNRWLVRPRSDCGAASPCSIWTRCMR